MDTVSTKTKNTTTKKPKIHRSRPAIASKVVAFQELTNLEKNSKSSREAAEILEVPNSSMQYWIERLEQDTTLSNAMIFLSTTPEGLKFLNRLVISVMKLMKCGPSGIRGMQEFLRNTGLDQIV